MSAGLIGAGGMPGADRVERGGGPDLRSVADAAGLSFSHLCGIENGREPLLDTDATALAQLLDVPADWPAPHGWA